MFVLGVPHRRILCCPIRLVSRLSNVRRRLGTAAHKIPSKMESRSDLASWAECEAVVFEEAGEAAAARASPWDASSEM